MPFGRTTAASSGLVQQRRDGPTDRARADDGNAYTHSREATALPFIQEHSRANSELSRRR